MLHISSNPGLAVIGAEVFLSPFNTPASLPIARAAASRSGNSNRLVSTACGISLVLASASGVSLDQDGLRGDVYVDVGLRDWKSRLQGQYLAHPACRTREA
jgi:hypothetical protein